MKPLDATREELQLRMDEAARNYARTHDPKYETEVWRINGRLAELRRVAVLENTVAACRKEISLTVSSATFYGLEFPGRREFNPLMCVTSTWNFCRVASLIPA